MGSSMAAKLRHWKEKEGRYWARISIPLALRPFFGNKTQITEPLGGDRRQAERNHAAAVARLQAQIDEAQRACLASAAVTSSEREHTVPVVQRRPVSEQDFEKVIWESYSGTLAQDASKRAAMPTPE